MTGVVPRITNSDAAWLAIIEIDVVDACSGYRNEFQLGQVRQLWSRNGSLLQMAMVASAIAPPSDLRSLAIVNPFMLKLGRRNSTLKVLRSRKTIRCI